MWRRPMTAEQIAVAPNLERSVTVQLGKTSNPEQTEKLAFTYREAAKALGVCERTVWGLVRDRKLRAIRVARCVRIPVAELERFLSEPTGTASR